MDEIKGLLDEIESFCRERAMAESTFGRVSVNDGKFVGRLRSGKGVTTRTVQRVRAFIAEGGAPPSRDRRMPNAHPNGKDSPPAGPVPEPSSGKATPAPGPGEGRPGSRAFRFYDNRQKYLMFVNTCSEKWVVSERVGMELSQIHPRPPAMRLFDAGMGDGTVLTRVMRDMHRRFPTVPFFIVGKEISLEDVRLSLEKMSDRFFEHPSTMLVITNLYYSEAPRLMPRSVASASALNWHEVALTGSTAHDFDEQIKALKPILTDGWQVRSSESTGNPLYVRPSVLVLYREDQRFVVDPIVPRPGQTGGLYDLVLAVQPYRARMSAEFKVNKVLAPLARALAPGGRLLGIHSYGRDPGREIVQGIWPGRELEQTSRHELMKILKAEVGRSERDLRFNTYSDSRSLFRYDMHTLPNEIHNSIGTSTLFSAWNASVYVYQVEDDELANAMSDRRYLDVTRDALHRHSGLWFLNESYVVSRRRP